MSDAVLGGLIGSILTVLVTKIIDLIHEARKHRYALRQSVFQNKLLSAEAIVAQWHFFSGAAGTFESLVEQWKERTPPFSSSSMRLLSRELETRLDEIRAQSANPTNTALLYFHMEDAAAWDSGPLQRVWYHFAALDTLKAQVAHLQGFFSPQTTMPAELGESLIAQFRRTQVEAIEQFEGLSKAYRELERAAHQALRGARADLKGIGA